jgi:hypothetical protein
MVGEVSLSTRATHSVKDDEDPEKRDVSRSTARV